MHHYLFEQQKWFLLYWNNPAEKCQLDLHEQEFESVRFVPLDECLDSVVEFKKEVYETLIKEFGPVIKRYLKELQ